MNRLQTVLVLLIGLVLAGCQTLYEEMPEVEQDGIVVGEPAGPSVVLPVPVVPVPTPVYVDPDATPTPAPESGDPGPTPTPAATPEPAPVSGGGGACSPGTGSGNNCPRTSPTLLGEVDAAIDALANQRPDLFSFGDQRGDGGWYVRDSVAYHQGVVGILNSWGYCAIYDGEEIAIKRSNEFSEQYDIHLSTGHVRRGEGMYRATCYPAWF